jgi:kynureninase
MLYRTDAGYAAELDSQDALADFRSRFLFPQHQGKPVVYFTGNSLGLQPKDALNALKTELEDWAAYGVEGHFQARNPWYSYHEMFSTPLAELVGALPEETVAMNTLSTNLHLLMVSFYRPSGIRTKILCEKKAFPSDIYAFQSQIRFHGLDPAEHLIELAPLDGEDTLRPEDILDCIHRHAGELALVMFSGVNYFTGQFYPMQDITMAGHAAGAMVGFDLAHTTGNIPLHLHDWGVDFATWCSYKYLNSGPGSVSGVYIHQKHLGKKDIPRFEGWWGTDPATRFKMEDQFIPMATAGAWQLSNAPVLMMAVHKVSLDIFMEAGMNRLREKSLKLTGYLEFLIQDINREAGKMLIRILTPSDPNQRGAQLSLVMQHEGRSFFDALGEQGIVADWREPNVIRVAPAPLYNSFTDVHRFYSVVKSLLITDTNG